MRYLTKSGKVAKCCINCKHFAFWDGDYCCIDKMAILQEGLHDNRGYIEHPYMTTQLEDNMQTPKTCEEYEYKEGIAKADYEYEYKKFRELQDQIELLEKYTNG